MKIKRIVLGTTNPGKLREWTKFLREVIPVIGISQLGKFSEPSEAGKTFRDNAVRKACYYAKLTKEYVFSEDGGYEVDALGGAPGTRSRRILPGGKEGTDQKLIDYVLNKLKGIKGSRRKVKLTVAAALADPSGKIIFEDTQSLPGIVSEKPGPVFIKGYPFRSIHFIPVLGKTYAELSEEEHSVYNHKKPMAERLSKFLLEYK